MARGRMLNTTVADDVRLNSVSIESHFLFMMTIPHLDRDGLIKADGMVFAGRVFPRRPELLPKMDALIQEWIDCSLVIAYQTDSHGRVLCFPNFAKNQIGLRYNREPASELPPPPGYIRTDEGLACANSVPPKKNTGGDNTPDTAQQSADNIQTDSRKPSGKVPANIPPNIREENVREGEEKAPPPGSAYVPQMSHHKLQAALTVLNARMEPSLRLKYVKPVESYLGLAALVEQGDDDALLKVHNVAADIFEMGVTLQNLRSWWNEWKNDFRSKGPSAKQFKEFCSEKLGETKAQVVMQSQPALVAGRLVDNPFSL
jgi:hypothetical protein